MDDGRAAGEQDLGDSRSKSSQDVHHDATQQPANPSTPVSRRKRIWNSLKNKTRKLRSRSKEKFRRRSSGSIQDDSVSLAHSQPDISGIAHLPDSPRLLRGSSLTRFTPRRQDFDDLFYAAEQRHQDSFTTNSTFVPEPFTMPRGDGLQQQSNGRLDRSRSEEKESEVDSGIAVVDQMESAAVRQRHSALRAHPFFQMEVILKEGRDLIVMDRSGTSDPYVKFKIGGKQYYKSRIVYKNLNPKWDEKFSLPIEDPFKAVQLKVFDYDRGLTDDPMGDTEIDPSGLEPNVPTELKLNLVDPKQTKGKPKNMGYLLLQCTLVPKTQDEKEQYFRKSTKVGETAKKLKTQIWSSVVTIILVEGKSLLPMDDNGFSDPYVKFRLGNEKFKSKYKPKTLNPRWLEQFDLHMFEDQTSTLEISVWDHDTGGRDDIMGRSTIDLSTLSHEETHTIDQPLEDGAGFITILLTISGTSGAETVSDLANYTPNPKEREDIVRKYGVFKSGKAIKDIGWLQVKVIKAQGLAAADLGGKSDPFCVLELVNARLQTQTEYKTLSPEWGKVFTFNVKDIHSVLEVTVYDEDRDKKAEFLGKVAIPLLRIQNGERRWFTLKDKKLRGRVKGHIQLEMDVIYNHVRAGERRWYQLKDKKTMNRAKGAIQLDMDLVFNSLRAAIRTFNPREEKFMEPEPKFKISTMKHNIDRVTKIAQAGVETANFLQSCFDWDSYSRSITAFAVYLIIVWNFELYMLPVTVLMLFLKNLLVVKIVGNLASKDKDDSEYVDEDDDDDEEDKEKEEKKGFKEKLQMIQDVCLLVQEKMDLVASVGERVKNTFNWTVPWLSWLAVTVLLLASIGLYLVPLRALLLAWGINKFTKKLRAPNAIPNNELLDFLSRIPSDKELVMYRDLRPDPSIGSGKKKRS